MVKKIENKIFEVFKMDCRGNMNSDFDFLSKENAEQVIVRVYENGDTIPVCRYNKGMRCTAPMEIDQGFCKYLSK